MRTSESGHESIALDIRMIRSVRNWAHPRKRPSLRLSVTGFMYLIVVEEV
jgi:hypothetical protein